jgi:hypothetical protein
VAVTAKKSKKTLRDFISGATLDQLQINAWKRPGSPISEWLPTGRCRLPVRKGTGVAAVRRGIFRDAKLLEILGDCTEKNRTFVADQVLAVY